ncbi:Gag-Pol polyprotein [Portunus trituberculatus]|uniref:Gag-Pol polyprotein n=1 Tax=Portunus trituberculatus TaxID=210409 RepID=A0A5B7GLM3_PORTR|nr:Gag-Pol polyprotein [Portunus trituberculatus]
MMRNRGESLQALAQDLDGTAHKAYPGAPPDMLNVLVRDQFVDALESVEFKIQVKQAQPKSLAEALARALEFESYVRSSTSNSRMEGSSRFRSQRAVLGESGDFSGSCWNCGRVRHRAEDCSCSRTRRIPRCWSCNKPGHLKRECPKMAELKKKASARTTKDVETGGVSGN